jgi:hypothetical protein
VQAGQPASGPQGKVDVGDIDQSAAEGDDEGSHDGPAGRARVAQPAVLDAGRHPGQRHPGTGADVHSRARDRRSSASTRPTPSRCPTQTPSRTSSSKPRKPAPDQLLHRPWTRCSFGPDIPCDAFGSIAGRWPGSCRPLCPRPHGARLGDSGCDECRALCRPCPPRACRVGCRPRMEVSHGPWRSTAAGRPTRSRCKAPAWLRRRDQVPFGRVRPPPRNGPRRAPGQSVWGRGHGRGDRAYPADVHPATATAQKT